MPSTLSQDLYQMMNNLALNSLYQKILNSFSNLYSIRHLRLETISPAIILQLLEKQKLSLKLAEDNPYATSNALSQQVWGSNQFKIFSWISICYSFLVKKQINLFDKQDLAFVFNTFPHKSKIFIQYNLKTLTKQVTVLKSKWSQEETDLLTTIMKSYQDDYQWTQISYQLYVRSNSMFYQSPQKCREQWINHLNPHVKKDKWAVNQDILLFRTVLDFGKKWSNISKLFNGSRTEHMVKNRYNSVIHKHQNKSNKVSEKKLCLKILAILEARQGKQDLGLPIKSQERHQTEVNGSIVSDLVQVMEEKQEILEIQNGNNSDAKMLIQTETVVENAKEPTKTENSPDSVAEDLEFGETLLNFEQTLFNIKSLSQSENAIKLQQIQFFQQNRHKSDEQYLFSLLA